MSTPNAFDAKDRQVIGSSRFNGYSPARSEIEIDWTFLARSHWGGTYNDAMKQMMWPMPFNSSTTSSFLSARKTCVRNEP